MRPLPFPKTVLVSLALLSLAGCGRQAADPRTEAPLVRVAAAQPAAAEERGFTGIVAARVQSNLGFRVAGKLSERLVDSGQTVRAGQALMRIDRTDYQHLAAVQAANLALAKARLDQAAADEARYAGLVEAGAISKSAYDQVISAADSARAQVAAAAAQLRLAQDDNDYATLIADADGTVVETLAEPGQVVAAGQVVIRLAHAGQREAAVNLPETVRPALGTIGSATLFGGDQRVPARLRQLSDAADAQTRTFEARFVLEGAASEAPLGATVTLYLPTAAKTGILVPLGALDDEGNGPGIWVVDANNATVSYRPVEIGAVGAETAILKRGAAAGETIVALGGHALHDGQTVRFSPAQVAQK